LDNPGRARGVLVAALCVLTACAHAKERKQERKQERIQVCIDKHPRIAPNTHWDAGCVGYFGRSWATCDSSTYISREAAICIAKFSGLRTRSSALVARLTIGDKADPAWHVYTKKARRLVWIRGEGLMMLDKGLKVDARTGEPTRPPPPRKRLRG
jgi:hypothetical protein